MFKTKTQPYPKVVGNESQDTLAQADTIADVKADVDATTDDNDDNDHDVYLKLHTLFQRFGPKPLVLYNAFPDSGRAQDDMIRAAADAISQKSLHVILKSPISDALAPTDRMKAPHLFITIYRGIDIGRERAVMQPSSKFVLDVLVNKLDDNKAEERR